MDDYGGRGGRGVAGRTVESTDDDVDDTAELDAAQIAHHVLLRFAAHLHTVHLPCVQQFTGYYQTDRVAR